MLWGNPSRTRTSVCQGRQSHTRAYSQMKRGVAGLEGDHITNSSKDERRKGCDGPSAVACILYERDSMRSCLGRTLDSASEVAGSESSLSSPHSFENLNPQVYVISSHWKQVRHFMSCSRQPRMFSSLLSTHDDESRLGNIHTI